MDSVEVNIHKHPMTMTLVKSGQTGYCCGIKFGGTTAGYYCNICNIFIHNICNKAPRDIKHPSHHECHRRTLSLVGTYCFERRRCALCGGKFTDDFEVLNYECGASCFTTLHLHCSTHPPPEVIDVPLHHDHILKLEKVESCFTCAYCGKEGDEYPYKCHECDLAFHVNCTKYPAEVNHSSHSLHPLKLVKGEPPAYTDGTCRLCAKKIVDYEVYYHCSTCNFTLDLHCVLNPPSLYHHDLNTHDHKLTLMPKSISFTCTTCGLPGDRSPYVCLPCDFTSHNDCSGFPWVININRHDHRVSRTSLLGVVNAVCGVCQKKMDWSCGGYSCKRCTTSVFHAKCATREDVWDGIEMKDKPEEDEDTEPFKIIDENTIQHFLHEEHNLRLDKSGIFVEERESCKACAYPIYHHSFYKCIACKFILHESCANLPKRKRHMVMNKPFILQTINNKCANCRACGMLYNGFDYCSGGSGIDVRCASISEPFFHQSHHPDHPLFYTTPAGVCSACNKEADHVLRCVEDDCGYVLDFKCALLPYEVKHRVDDHFLSLCYGEKDSKSGKYWCDICEKETDPKAWFYTCKDCGVTLHTNCVLGDFRGLDAGKRLNIHVKDCETVRNNSMSRPSCHICKSRCIFPIILKLLNKNMPDIYYCSNKCSEAGVWKRLFNLR
ncbi:hypothetical protein AALP_AA7G035800 [Arabis alpina]|uniref:Zinc finger PHD-type domain-containing protein n=1 Tax=Arabis alpina TaxID=50452 RepID=A0A087GFQ2_ARAAL|nr:hypothetical protein AALP_AA7G035800 [Arabis alpina]